MQLGWSLPTRASCWSMYSGAEKQKDNAKQTHCGVTLGAVLISFDIPI